MPRKATKETEKPKPNTRSRNRRKVEDKPPKQSRKLLVASPRTVSEVGAVALGALGLITLLALASYHPDDASLNARRFKTGQALQVAIGLICSSSPWAWVHFHLGSA